MNKKGFTLVELLAVIAILAILVIVAVPNVMKSLKQAKENSFLTEVQNIISTAETQWISDQISNGMETKSFEYADNNTEVNDLGSMPSTVTKKLQLDGNKKSYYILMNNNGKPTKIIIADGNFCYISNGYDTATSESTEINKIDITKQNIYEVSSNDSFVEGCGSLTNESIIDESHDPIISVEESQLSKYSWPQIKVIADKLANNIITYDELKSIYKIDIGQTKKATINGEEHEFRLVDINHDIDENNNKLGMTFEQVDLMNYNPNYIMKSSMTNNDGWENSDLKNTINGLSIQSDLDEIITPAKKPCVKSVTNNNLIYVTSKLWLMSETEISNMQTNTYGNTIEGTPYKYYTDNRYTNESKKKKINTNSAYYWLRTPSRFESNTSYFAYINVTSLNNISSSRYGGVSLCFCIGKKENGKNLYETIKSLSSGKITNFKTRSGLSRTNGVYETTATDSGDTVYYYRGNVNNHIIFNNMCFRIIRTTETSGVKLIYNGPQTNGKCLATGENTLIEEKTFNNNYNDKAYLGYMYGTVGSSNYNATHTNANNSNIKSYIDNWFRTNFTSISSALEDTVFCNDRSMVTYNSEKIKSEAFSSYGTLGYGKNSTLYGTLNRSSYYTINPSPSLACPNPNDKFTVSSSNGNGALTYPIGLITTDEAIFAGFNTYASSNTNNGIVEKETYLYSQASYWTMSPAIFSKDGSGFMWAIGNEGYILGKNVSLPYGIRPVISLSSGTTILSSGAGTSLNPYIYLGR